MRVDLKAEQAKQLTVCSYGPSGAGKTRWAGSWPRPVFLADAVEGGWETLKYMEPDELWDPTWETEVEAIDSYQALNKQIDLIAERVKTKPQTAPQTIVIDSITFVSRMVQDMIAVQYAADIARNKWFAYTQLNERLRHIMTKTHHIGIHTLWLALSTIKEGGHGGPLIPGQTADFLPAACQYILFHTVDQPQTSNGQQVDPVFSIHTRKHGPYWTRVRGIGKYLPDPLPDDSRGYSCTYRGLIEEIARIRTKLQKPNGQQQVAAKAPVQRMVAAKRPQQ